MLVGLVAAMLPWWVRNARVTGHFVPTTLQVGASLYDGLSPQATGASDMSFVNRFVSEEQPEAGRKRRGGQFEYRLDRRMRRAAIAWACAHPGPRAATCRSQADPDVEHLARTNRICPRGRSAWASWLRSRPFSGWGLWGAARTIRGGWPYVLCWLPAVYFSLLHTVFVSSIRYRQPPMLLLIVLAAGVASLETKWEV